MANLYHKLCLHLDFHFPVDAIWMGMDIRTFWLEHMTLILLPILGKILQYEATIFTSLVSSCRDN